MKYRVISFQILVKVLLFLTCTFIPTSKIWGESTQVLQIACSHPQVCRLIDWMYDDKAIQTSFPIGQITGDPHHFEPSPKDLKSLLEAPLLVSAPLQLQPWLRGVLRQRTRNQELNTLTLSTTNFKNYYPRASRESLAHFWLFPEAICSMAEQINVFLREEYKNDSEEPLEYKIDCQKIQKQLAQSFKNFQEQTGYTLILTHDALTPLLKKYEVKHLALRSSGHGDRINSRHLRELENLINQSKYTPLIWVEEDQLLKNSQLQAKKRDFDLTLNLTTDGPINYEQKDSNVDGLLLPLNQIITFLSKLTTVETSENE